MALTNRVVDEALLRLVPERKERIMGWFSQTYFEEGRAEGIAEGEVRGKARGEAIGKAKVLARLLERRFGAIPASVRSQIFAADAASVEVWVERAFDAPDLQSVFGANGPTAS